jgi:hypothetical protein
VNVAERPVVHSSVSEIIQCAGAVREVVRIASDIAVKKRDMKARFATTTKPACEILRNIALPVADSMHGGN